MFLRAKHKLKRGGVLKSSWVFMRSVPGSLLEMVCPACCEVCHQELLAGSDIICSECWAVLREGLLSSACPVCGLPAGPYELIDGVCHRCHNTRPVVSRVIRVGGYEDVLRSLILSFKFRGQSRLDRFLGGMMASAMMGDRLLDDIDILVPVPLHWRRFLTRGYNQSELLVREITRELKRQGILKPVSYDLLRVRNTRPQVSLSASARKGNLKGAFAARPDANFQGKHICLVDDVTTTGTTLKVAGHALKRAGARRISAVVLTVAKD